MMWQTILYTSIALIVIIFLIVFVVYVVNLKNLKSQKQHFKEIHQGIRVGVKVEVLNGFYGRIESINEETIDLKVKSGAILEVSRYAITKIIH